MLETAEGDKKAVKPCKDFSAEKMIKNDGNMCTFKAKKLCLRIEVILVVS